MLYVSLSPLPVSQDIKKREGPASLVGQALKLKTEAERLDVMDQAAGVLAELLFDDNFLQQIKDYRPLLLLVHVCHVCIHVYIYIYICVYNIVGI